MITGRMCIACVMAFVATLGCYAQVSGPRQSAGMHAETDLARGSARESETRANQDAVVRPKSQTEPQLPDAPSGQVRLTAKQKFETFARRTYSPYTFASAAFNASWAQAVGGWYDYGGGMQGWGKRFGASLANVETRMVFSSFLLPVVFHQDPRYHPSGRERLLPRAWYAGTRIFVTRSDDGDRMFNYSEVLGVLFTSSVQNAYYPERDRGFGNTMQRVWGGLASDATSNLLREFSPELKRAARKILPKRARKLQEKLPDSVKEIGGQVIVP